MARFDVFDRREGPGYLLDCQAELLSDLTTRFVVPLLPQDAGLRPAARLNPVFMIGGAPHVMMTQFAAAVHRAELGDRFGSLREDADAVVGALDLLITGV